MATIAQGRLATARKILSPVSNSALASANSVEGMAPAAASLNTSEGKPLHVQVVEAGMKTQMWKTARALAIAFVIVSGIGVGKLPETKCYRAVFTLIIVVISARRHGRFKRNHFGEGSAA